MRCCSKNCFRWDWMSHKARSRLLQLTVVVHLFPITGAPFWLISLDSNFSLQCWLDLINDCRQGRGLMPWRSHFHTSQGSWSHPFFYHKDKSILLFWFWIFFFFLFKINNLSVIHSYAGILALCWATFKSIDFMWCPAVKLCPWAKSWSHNMA